MIKKILPDETHPLRQHVLGRNIPDYQFVYSGDQDKNTLHFGYFDHEELTGILTVMQTNIRSFQFRGMAVSEIQQGKNIGGKLLEFATEYVCAEAESIWLNARQKVVPFYLKNGFLPEGDYFEIEPIGLHLKMSKLIK